MIEWTFCGIVGVRLKSNWLTNSQAMFTDTHLLIETKCSDFV